MEKDRVFIEENLQKFPYLPAREQKILGMLYGLEQLPLSLQQVAAEFGVSERRIETARKRAVNILKKLDVDS